MSDSLIHEQKLNEILAAALEQPPELREEVVSRASQGDEGLRREVMSLLAASAEPSLDLPTGGAQGSALWAALARESTEQSPVPEGTRIGSYRVLREIGSGGMGAVYLAERADQQFRQQVAIKLLKRGADTDEVIARFEQERQILATLNHPAIARLSDGGTTADGRSFFAMELVEGVPIDQYCDTHRLTIKERLQLFIDVARAVHYAHRNLVVHRDLKPSNILVTGEGQIKLLDFGIAKILDDSPSADALPTTRTWVRIMTPQYASPEQVLGQPVTTASDIYQLGLLLYELLSGHFPYLLRGKTAAEVEQVICRQDPQLPSEAILAQAEPDGEADAETLTPEKLSHSRRSNPQRLRKQLAGDLDNIVLMALRKEPERRYVSAAQLYYDINRYLAGHPVTARKDTLRYRLRKLVQRHTMAAAATAVVVTLLAATVTFYTFRLTAERDRARVEAEKAVQVAGFMKELFAIPDPGRAQGEEMLVREFLDRGAERIESELAEQPEVQAEIMAVLGVTYTNLAMYEKAQSILERALEVRLDLWGENHLGVAASLNDLARVYMNKGSYEEAEPLYRRAVKILEGNSEAEPTNLAMVLNNLAVLHIYNHELEQAEPLAKRVLEIREKALEPDDPEVAAAINNLGGILLQQGKYEQAEPLFRRSLEMREQAFGKDHSVVGEGLNNLAVLYQRMGRSESAAVLLERTISIWQKTLGPEHPKVGWAYNNLAVQDLIQGNYGKAESHFTKALSILEKSVGVDHPRVASCLNNLAGLRQNQLRLDEAELLYHRALAIKEEKLGPTNPSVALLLLDLADFYTRQERYDEAEPLQQRAQEILEDSFGADDFYYAETVGQLARLRTGQRRYDEARSLFDRSLAAMQRLRADGQLNQHMLGRLAELYLSNGNLFQQIGDSSRARECWISALEAIEETDASTTRVALLSARARALLSLGRVDEARAFVHRALATDLNDQELLALCRQHDLDVEVNTRTDFR